MNLNVQDNNIVLSKKVRIPVVPGDNYTFSPADKTIYIVRTGEHFENGTAETTVVMAYNLKGELSGKYDYKNSQFVKFCQIEGYANMVYSVKQDNGYTVFYQAKLLPNGYCTDVRALHARDKDGKLAYFDDLAKAEKPDDGSSDEAEMTVDSIVASVAQRQAADEEDKVSADEA